MDKHTLSNYGWIIILTLVMGVMLAIASPFGNYVGDGIVNIANAYGIVNEDAVNVSNVESMSDEWEGKFHEWGNAENNDNNKEPSEPTVKKEPFSTISPITFNGLTEIQSYAIWSDGENTYHSRNNQHHILDGNTWKPTSFSGLIDFGWGSYVWSDGEHTYYSYEDKHYVLNGNTWVEKTWNGLTRFYGNEIFVAGENIYYAAYDWYPSGVYLLQDDTWVELAKPDVMREESGYWTDGTDLYFSAVENLYVYKNEVWEEIEIKFTEEKDPYIYRSDIYTDGTYAYYCGTYVFKDGVWETLQLNDTSWYSYNNFWTDGTNTYYSDGPNNYILS